LKKNILGIISSPRRLGNCEIFIKEICRNFNFEFDLKLIRLTDFSIRPCKGCYQCLAEPYKCPLKDDLDLIIQAMTDADALIVAVPTYFLGPNGMLKLLLDRGLSFYAHSKQLWHKPAIGVGIAGIKGKEGYTLLGIENFFNVILADIKDSCIVYGALPGEVFLNERNRRVAKDLATILFTKRRSDDAPCCPLCQSKTFRFLKKNQVQCMLCSNKGTLIFQNNEISIHIDSNGHDFTLNAKAANEHRRWLEGMKHRFIKEKTKLKKIILNYRKDGDWIRPNK
jgi:multimeric flavodoxin WrbA